MDVYVFTHHSSEPDQVYQGVISIHYEGHDDHYLLYLYNNSIPIKVDGSKILELKA